MSLPLFVLGLMPNSAVGIMGFNSPEWYLAYLGAIFAGGLPCGLYVSNNEEACYCIASSSKAHIMVVENDTQLAKILAIRKRLPLLRVIIQYKGEPSVKDPAIYSWSDIINLAKDEPDCELTRRIENLRANQCCTLIYTSGTTGKHKGALISHDNLTWTAINSATCCGLKEACEVLVSYRSMSHVGTQVLDLAQAIAVAATIYFPESDLVKDSLLDTLREARPTTFTAFPLLWQKFEERIVAAASKSFFLGRYLMTWARGIGTKGVAAKSSGGPLPYGWTLANAILFRKTRAQLGLDRCKLLLSGAATLPEETWKFFASLNMFINEIYGMTELTGPHTIYVPPPENVAHLPGNVGKTLSGKEALLVASEDGCSEISVEGRNVFMGYLDEEKETKATFDEDFRLRSGDVGRLDSNGYLYITGRIKDMIVDAKGDNIWPQFIEEDIKSSLPLISSCIVIGNKRKFLSALICLKSRIDNQSQIPLDEMAAETKEWCRQLGSRAAYISEIAGNKDELINRAIETCIDRANKRAETLCMRVHKFRILPRNFSVTGGELGPTCKVKRRFVEELYHDIIEKLYSESCVNDNDPDFLR